MTDKLLPCPFCGSEPEIVRRAGAAGIKCTCAGKRFLHTYGKTVESAAASWNERAAPPQTNMTPFGLLKEAIQSVEASMAADAPDGETVDPAHYDVVMSYEDAKKILAGLTPSPQTNTESQPDA